MSPTTWSRVWTVPTRHWPRVRLRPAPARYTVDQADVDAGSVTNTATASATNPSSDTITSNSSSVTVPASDATSSLSLAKSAITSAYGAAGDTIDYDYVVMNTGTTTISGIGVSDNLVSSVNCPDSILGARSVRDLHRQLHGRPGRCRRRVGDEHGDGVRDQPAGRHHHVELVLRDRRGLELDFEPEPR